MKKNWNQPQCTDCWVGVNSEPWIGANGAPDDDGMLLIRKPVRVNYDDWEKALQVCSFCGRVTTSGIFVRADPDTVPHPAPADGE